MDSLIAAAASALASAQLGEYPRARELLRRAARGFGNHEELARARCIVAGAEVALAMRDFAGSPRALASAADTLDARAGAAGRSSGGADCARASSRAVALGRRRAGAASR